MESAVPESGVKNGDMTLRASFLTAFICFLFGGNTVAIKLSLTGLGAYTTAGIRFAVAAMIILCWAWVKKIPIKINPKQVGQTLILAAVFVVQLSLFYNGMVKTTASHGALISNVLPFFILILAHFFIPGDRITAKKAVGITLGFIGVIILFFDTPDMAYDLKTGDGIILTAVVFWAAGATRVKQIIAEYNFLQITLYPMMFAVPFFFIAGFFWDDRMVGTISGSVLSAMFYQSFITASFGFLVWNSLLQKYGAVAMHSFVFIMPLSGVLLGVLMLGDPVTPHLAASIILIVAGVMVVNIKRRTPPVC